MIESQNGVDPAVPAQEVHRLFEFLSKRHRHSLEDYLCRRGVSLQDSEEAVQDFFAKQLTQRTIFSRLQDLANCGKSPREGLQFLRACVMRHYLDMRRAEGRYSAMLAKAAEANGDPSIEESPIAALSYAWSVSILQVAIHDLRASLMAEGADGADGANDADGAAEIQTGAGSSRRNHSLNWQIFLERFVSPAPRQLEAQSAATLIEMGRRLGLSKGQLTYRISCLRKQFHHHLRRAVADACPGGDLETLMRELCESLIISGARLPDLLADVPQDSPDSSLDSVACFSLSSCDRTPGDEIIDLLIDPDAATGPQAIHDLWSLIMQRQVIPRDIAGSHGSSRQIGQSGNSSRRWPTIEELVFCPSPCLPTLSDLKSVARQNAQCDHLLLSQVYHLLYILTISRAKNVYDKTITTMTYSQRLRSLRHGLRYAWAPELAVQELEKAFRRFSQEF